MLRERKPFGKGNDIEKPTKIQEAAANDYTVQ